MASKHVANIQGVNARDTLPELAPTGPVDPTVALSGYPLQRALGHHRRPRHAQTCRGHVRHAEPHINWASTCHPHQHQE